MIKKLLIVIATILLYITTNAQISNYSPSTTMVSKCTNGASISLNVATTGTLIITMPANISYVPGSVMGATELLINGNTVTFNVATSGIVTYNHTATCAANEALPFTDQATINGGTATISNAYNVAEAAPQVTSVTNTPTVANVGQIVAKAITIANGGIGKTSDIYYQDIVPAGTYFFDQNSIKIGTYSVPASQVSLTSGGGFDTLTVHLVASDMQSFGNNDTYFNGNDPTIGAPPQESFNLMYNATPITCGTGYAINSTHRIYYGCGSICSDLNFSSLLDLNIPTAPNINFTYTGDYTSCININTPVNRTLTITNTGGPATNISLTFGNYYAYSGDNAYASYIDTSTFKYSINGGPLQSPVYTNVINNAYTWGGDSVKSGTAGQPSLLSFSIPVIPAGATVTFSHQIRIGCEGNNKCQAGNSNGFGQYDEQMYIKAPSSYKNACGDVTYNIENQYFSYRGISHSATLNYPSDIVGGQTAPFTTNIVSSINDLSEIAPGGYLEINTTLPDGYVLSGIPNAVSGTITWPGTTSLIGNVLTTRFYFPRPASFDMNYFQYNLNLSLDCSLRTSASTSTIYQTQNFVQDPACGCVRQLVCMEGSPNIHCPSPCPEGINNLYASSYRKNFGLPDANNDGVADIGPYDYSKMATQLAYYGDTVEYTYGGIINWITANGPYSNAYAESNISNFSGKFNALDADVTVYRNGTIFSGPSFYTPIVTGNIAKTDFSNIVAALLQGDSIVTHLRTKVIDPALIQGQQEIGYTSINYMYASRTANPPEADTTIASGRKYCDSWGGTINTVSSYYTYDAYGPTAIGCSQAYLVTYQYFSVGLNGTNNYYQKDTRFPYEVRKWTTADTSLFLLPQSYGYNVDSAQIIYNRTAGLANVSKTIYSVPFSVVGDSVFVNSHQYYAEYGGPSDNPISDGGWQVTTQLFISTNCKTTIEASPIGFGFDMNPYAIDSTHVPYSFNFINKPTNYGQYPKIWEVASFTRTIQSTPVQLVAGGGGVKNVAGKAFTYSNVIISNQTNSPSNFGFVNFITGANTTITSVVYGGNTIIKDVNGYYNIGGFSAAETKILSVTGITTSCAPDTVKMYYGWDCRGIPTVAPTSANQCSSPLKLILKPLPAKIDGAITPLQNTPPDPSIGTGVYGSTTANMCDPFPVELIINSAVQGSIYDILANIQLPAGISYVPNSAYWETPIGSTPIIVSVAQETALGAVSSGGILPFDIQQMTNNLVDSLQGTVGNPASIRQIKIRFLAKADCNYNGKGRIRATLLANRACGIPALNNGTIKSGNTLKLTPPSGTFAVTVTPTISSINGCGISVPGSVSINKTDATIPTYLDSISMSVPSSIDLNNISCSSCTPALGTPSIIDDGNTKTLTWNYPAGNVTGLLTINFDATINNKATCSNPVELSASVLQQKVLFCNAVACPGATTVEAGTGSANFNINLPSFSIANTNVSTYSTLPPYSYDVQSTITNTSVVNSSGYTIIYAYDVDGDSIITNADVILKTQIVNNTLNAGSSVIINETFTTTTSSNGAELIIGIVSTVNNQISGTCACGDVYKNTIIATGLTASLGDRVWNDINKDGIQDIGEVGVAGITVTLYNNAGQVVGSTITDAYGNYLFSNLVPADYSVGFTLPPNYVFSPSTGTSETDATNSDVNIVTGHTSTVTLSAGENQLNIDAGIYFAPPTTASVGNYVWNDLNADGIQDPNEMGISGVTVTLYDVNGVVVATTITDANGYYLFTDVIPGTYSVGFTSPVGYLNSPNNGAVSGATNSDANSSTGKTTPFNVNAGDKITYVDAGFYAQPITLGSLGDKVWNDINQNGVQDSGEPGVAGVTVTLYGADGTTVIATTSTDAFGNYIFNNLAAGQYVVGFSNLPVNYTLTSTAGTDSTTNSNANIVTGKSDIINLGVGQHNMTIDAGIYTTNILNTNSIGDKVWDDINKDGIQDANEAGVAGVTVTLYDNLGNVIAVTSTDANGNYLFPDLPNGIYHVGFSNLPDGYIFSPTGQGTSTTDNDANPATGMTSNVTLSGGTHLTDVDAGINIGNVKIGQASLGDLVWYDLNGDGIQNAGESGVAGVTVTLYGADGTTVIATTTTDALGNYIFTGLTSGNYVVGFTNLPTGFTISPKNTDALGINGELNSDVNAGTQKTDVIILGSGEDKLSVDMGIVPPTGTASLGDLVWYDLNGDGLQSGNEPGVGGITVTLYDATGNIVATTTTDANGEYHFVGLTPGTYNVGFSNLPAGFIFTTQNTDNVGVNGSANSDVDPTTGRTSSVTLASGDNNLNIDAGIKSTTVASVGNYVWFDANHDGIQDPNESGIGGVLVTLYDASGNAVASTITKSDGSYIFTNVTPGTYSVGFSNLPTGMVFTTQEADPTSTTGSNVNPSTGITPTFTVTAGTYNPTIDAGLITPLLTGLGNFVWNDINQNGIQDAGEPGVPGVTVTLYAADGTTVISTAVTDGNGAYSFTNLPAGNYIVGFSNLPVGFTRTQEVGGLNDATNSDMNMDGKTNIITLIAGIYNPNIDAGIYLGFPLSAKELFATMATIINNTTCSVNWYTKDEVSTHHFNIERSTDGIHFTKVGEKIASINTSGRTNYSIDDNIESLAKENTLYYRIQLIDIDNNTSLSNVISTRREFNNEVKIYPQPFTNKLNIDYATLQETEIDIKITDLTGNIVKKQHNILQQGINKIEIIGLSQLASANYVITILDVNNGQQFIQKLVK